MKPKPNKFPQNPLKKKAPKSAPPVLVGAGNARFEAIYEAFKAADYRGQINGPMMSGKTALAQALIQRAEQQGVEVELIDFSGSQEMKADLPADILMIEKMVITRAEPFIEDLAENRLPVLATLHAEDHLFTEEEFKELRKQIWQAEKDQWQKGEPSDEIEETENAPDTDLRRLIHQGVDLIREMTGHVKDEKYLAWEKELLGEGE